MSQPVDPQSQPTAPQPTPQQSAPAPAEGAPAKAQAAPAQPEPAKAGARQADADRISAGYAVEGDSLRLGAVMLDGEPYSEALVRIPLSMMNRHGLIAGATGTGKTRTLQLIAEQLSDAGVPVFAADIKSDLSGLAQAGTPNDKIATRSAQVGDDWKPTAYPVEFYSLGGDKTQGTPLRATVTSFGPILLSKVLGLNDTQESSLQLMFSWADNNGLPLLDLKDLRAVISYLTSDEGKAQLADIGGVSKATAGVILREISALQSSGADQFFGEPEFDTRDLLAMRGTQGVVSLVELAKVQNRPELFSTFLMWLLADLYTDLPEVGDLDKPKLVFFFDEAHLLFNNASKAFLQAVTQTVRLIRSKGVGVFFVTQQPTDVPDDVLAQLGNRVQHALRAYTPDDAAALAKTVKTYPKTTDYDLAQALTQLGTGEAIVTVMSERGAPTPVAWTRLPAPRAAMSPADPQTFAQIVNGSPQMAKYGQEVDRDSAYERLAARTQGAGEKGEPAAGAQEQPRSAPRERAAKPEKSTVEKFFENGAVKQFMRSAAAAIARNFFGTARRRR